MGLTWDQINEGAANIANIFGTSMQAWRALSGPQTPPVAATTQPVTNSPGPNPDERLQGTVQVGTSGNLILILGIVVIVALILKGKR